MTANATIDDVARDVARALRDPNLTEHDSATLACLLVTKRCSYQVGRAAVEEVRSRCQYNLPLDLGAVWAACRTKEPRPVRIDAPWASAGRATNVLRLYTMLTGGAIGERAARVLGEVELGQELKKLNWYALGAVVDCQPVCNDNDPMLTDSPYWTRKVQGAWVAATLARRSVVQ